jgi:hypothetical protein
MVNLMLLLPLAGICLALVGLVRHNRLATWIGLALILGFLALGLLDRLLAG